MADADMRDAGRVQAGEAAGPHLPPEIPAWLLRPVADTLRERAEEIREWARRIKGEQPWTADYHEKLATVWQALADWVKQEAARREQAGCAAKVEILHACMPDEAWASQEQEEGGIRGGR